MEAAFVQVEGGATGRYGDGFVVMGSVRDFIKVTIPKLQKEDTIKNFEIVFRKYDESKKLPITKPSFILRYPFQKPKKGLFAKKSADDTLGCELKDNFYITRHDKRFYYSVVEFSIDSDAKFFNSKNDIFEVAIKENDKYYHKYYISFDYDRKWPLYHPFRDIFESLYSYEMDNLKTIEAKQLKETVITLFLRASEERHLMETPFVQLVVEGYNMKYSNIPNALLEPIPDFEEKMKSNPYFVAKKFCTKEVLHYLERDVFCFLGLYDIFSDEIRERVKGGKLMAYEELLSIFNFRFPNTHIQLDNTRMDDAIVFYILTKPLTTSFE